MKNTFLSALFILIFSNLFSQQVNGIRITSYNVCYTKLLRIPYAVIAISTDYDCWKNDEEPVSIDIVLENFRKSVDKLILLLEKTVKYI